ncbi:hypothetical protein ACJX0J_026440 [Zea mays]
MFLEINQFLLCFWKYVEQNLNPYIFLHILSISFLIDTFPTPNSIGFHVILSPDLITHIPIIDMFLFISCMFYNSLIFTAQFIHIFTFLAVVEVENAEKRKTKTNALFSSDSMDIIWQLVAIEFPAQLTSSVILNFLDRDILQQYVMQTLLTSLDKRLSLPNYEILQTHLVDNPQFHISKSKINSVYNFIMKLIYTLFFIIMFLRQKKTYVGPFKEMDGSLFFCMKITTNMFFMMRMILLVVNIFLIRGLEPII